MVKAQSGSVVVPIHDNHTNDIVKNVAIDNIIISYRNACFSTHATFT